MAAARSSLRRLAAESLRAAGPAGVDFGGSRQLCIAAASGASLLHRGSDLSGPSFSGRQLEHPVKALAGFAAYQQVRSASWGSWGSWGSGGGAKAPPAVPVQAVPAEEAQAGAATAAEQALQAATQAVDAAAAVTASGGSEIAAIADQSWYPILGLQYLIENIHLTLGVPWWVAIVGTTITLRTIALPLVIMQMKNTVKLAQAKPEIERLAARAKLAANDPNAGEQYMKDLTLLWKKYDCHPKKSFAPLFAQFPIFVSFFMGIRRMAEGVPSFKDGGALWFTDLTIADPYYISPLLSSASFLLTVELSAVDGMQPGTQSQNMKWGLRALGVAMVPLTASFPQGVFVYWITSNFYSLGQSQLLRNKAVKKLVGIPEMLVLPDGTAKVVTDEPKVLLSNKPVAKKAKK